MARPETVGMRDIAANVVKWRSAGHGDKNYTRMHGHGTGEHDGAMTSIQNVGDASQIWSGRMRPYGRGGRE